MIAPNALIISASTGTGHVSAGRALHAAFEVAGYATVLHVDVLELAPRWVRAAYGGGFELLAARAPGVWREVYRRSDGGHTDEARWGTIARRLIFREFERLLASERWTFCVCTHFLPGQLAAGRAGAPPFATVVTDFTLHRYWVQPRVGQYFVATPDMARDLHVRLPAAHVVATGIPTAGPFADRTPQAAARASLGLPLTSR
ncbi:MAG: MGDG synthase family glycosyltransferase, partial [Longimicrobiales bacterium]